MVSMMVVLWLWVVVDGGNGDDAENGVRCSGEGGLVNKDSGGGRSDS